MSKPSLLLLASMAGPLVRDLEERYQLHCLWQAPDRLAFLRQLSTDPSLTAVATVVGQGVNAELFSMLPQVRFVASFGVGYDGADVTACHAARVLLTHTPDVLNECVADTAWMLILATVRRTAFHDQYIRKGAWLKGPAPLTDKVWGETLGLLGLGRIGKAIARRAEGFGMKVIYHGRQQQANVSYPWYPSPVALAKACKILVVATPGGKGTVGIVNAEVLRALGPSGYLINISRGSTVNEQDLITALEQGEIAGAGLDVFQNEPQVPAGLIKLENVTLQPHVGSATHSTRAAMSQCVLDNLEAWFSGRPAPNVVPELHDLSNTGR